MPDDTMRNSLVMRIETDRKNRAELILADAISERTKLYSEGQKVSL